jgi:hypothetical protein
MKKYLLLSVFVAMSAYLHAQVFELYTEDHSPFTVGDTLFLNGNAGDDLLAAHMHIKNVSTQTQEVYARKSYVNVLSGTFNAFCWAGACFTSFVSPIYAEIETNITNEEFSTEYMPQGVVGSSVIRYTFFTQAGDSAWFFVKYTVVPTGISGNQNLVSVSPLFPNPARENVNLVIGNFQGSVNVEIHDLTGKMVKSFNDVKTGMVQIPVGDMKKGLYFVDVTWNGRSVKTQKLMVR